MSELFLLIAPFAATLITQISKKIGKSPQITLAIISVLGGVGHYFFLALPDTTQAQMLAVSAAIWAMATGIYKTLLKFFPKISSKNN